MNETAGLRTAGETMPRPYTVRLCGGNSLSLVSSGNANDLESAREHEQNQGSRHNRQRQDCDSDLPYWLRR